VRWASKPVIGGQGGFCFKRFADVNSIDIELDTEAPEPFNARFPPAPWKFLGGRRLLVSRSGRHQGAGMLYQLNSA